MPAKPEIITADNIDPKYIYSISTGDNDTGFGIVARATKQPADDPARFYCYMPGKESYKPFTCSVSDAVRAGVRKMKIIEEQDIDSVKVAFGRDYLVI